jgi:(E)-4-hydroxy-3-methylbut-2-enyl-diphosphate synthase
MLYKNTEAGFPEVIQVAAISNQDVDAPGFFAALGCEIQQGRYVKGLKAPEAVYCLEPITAQDKLPILKDLGIACYDSSDPRILKIDLSSQGPSSWSSILDSSCECIIAFADANSFFLLRELQEFLSSNKALSPLIVAYRYVDISEKTLIAAAVDLGSCLVDKIGQGVMLISKSLEQSQPLMLNILQACRKRLFKTDYIACPGCGRTLFDLQQVTQHIQEKTAHLPGVKIAVMGCIVNGPGEMADADFGYVGTKSGIVDLYVGKICVEKNIPSEKATDRLIELIKSHGKWVEPVSSE